MSMYLKHTSAINGTDQCVSIMKSYLSQLNRIKDWRGDKSTPSLCRRITTKGGTDSK